MVGGHLVVVVAAVALGGGSCTKPWPSPENSSPRTTVEAEFHMARSHINRQEVLAARVVAVQKDTIPRVWPKSDFELRERKIMLRLQGPGRGGVGPQRLSELRDAQGKC